MHTLYQEQAVFGKMKMDPAKRAQTQNAGEVSSLQLQLILYVLARLDPPPPTPPPQPKKDEQYCAHRETRPHVTRLLRCASDHWTTSALI
jgi:hypothetical protein